MTSLFAMNRPRKGEETRTLKFLRFDGKFGQPGLIQVAPRPEPLPAVWGAGAWGEIRFT
jgi:hypothetical protein